MSRRVLFGGATAVAAAGVLSACGSSSSRSSKASETPFYEINEQMPRSSSRAVSLNLSAYSLGPDFNRFSQNGSSTSVSETMGVIAGCRHLAQHLQG